MTEPKPCPFCGEQGVTIREGSTYRWRLAECNHCGACGPETRIRTMTPLESDDEVREMVIDTWNARP